MSISPEDAAKVIARRKVGETRVSQLPIAPIQLVDMFMSGFMGTNELAAQVIIEVATSEFGLVINGDGLIDLPAEKTLNSSSNLQVLYKEPTTYYVRSTEMPKKGKSTKKNADGKHIDTED